MRALQQTAEVSRLRSWFYSRQLIVFCSLIKQLDHFFMRFLVNDRCMFALIPLALVFVITEISMALACTLGVSTWIAGQPKAAGKAKNTLPFGRAFLLLMV